MEDNIPPPVATRSSQILENHGDSREDPYYWLGNRDNPDVIKYLQAENQYAEHLLAETKELGEQIYQEMKSRIVESDMSAPVRDGPFEYYHRESRDENYITHYRRYPGQPNTEQLVVDENELAKGLRYFRLRALTMSPDHQIAGYATDISGNERYTISFLNLANRQPLPDVLLDTSGNLKWDNTGEYVYYTTLNKANRPYRLYRHRMGDNPDSDQLLFEEPDEAFYMWLSKSSSRRYLHVTLHSAVTTEVHLLDAWNPAATTQLVFPRTQSVEYWVEDRGDDLFVLTNENAVNFRLMKTSIKAPNKSNWQTVVEHAHDATLTHFQVFENFIAVAERRDGLPGVFYIAGESTEIHRINKPPQTQELHIGENREFSTSQCRLNGNSLDMPLSQYDCDMNSGICTLVKTKPVGGRYEPSDYATEQYKVKSHDGTDVPLYIVYRKDVVRSRPAPLLLYAYGAYGISYPLYFSSARLSLLDRGIIFAVAHVRGGGELGKPWYHAGKLLQKKNTFHDFRACAKFLITNNVTSAEKLAISGGSAGGLVVGNYINECPNQCKVALAHVPFVDILTTILDDSLPLSIIEREEWGDPNLKELYDYIKSYSPYDNVQSDRFPALFITAGLNDPRVGYWEPAKWAAKIRSCKTDSNPLLLKTEMHSGHGGKSARHESLRETAEEFAFVTNQLLNG